VIHVRHKLGVIGRVSAGKVPVGRSHVACSSRSLSRFGEGRSVSSEGGPFSLGRSAGGGIGCKLPSELKSISGQHDQGIVNTNVGSSVSGKT
jgi:hypothetical protein